MCVSANWTCIISLPGVRRRKRRIRGISLIICFVLVPNMALHQSAHAFLCPITQVLMGDPVLCSDGMTYERSAIELWMRTQNVSPVTGQALFHKDLTPNDRLRAAIQAFQQQQIAPSPPPPSRVAPSAPPLPPGWQPFSSRGSPVYVNPSSGEISHERPNAPVSQSSSSAPSAPSCGASTRARCTTRCTARLSSA